MSIKGEYEAFNVAILRYFSKIEIPKTPKTLLFNYYYYFKLFSITEDQ